MNDHMLLARVLMLWRQMDDEQREKAMAFLKAQVTP